MRTELGKSIDVTVRSRTQLEQIIADNPYPDGAANQVNVVFLMKALPAAAEEAMARLATEREPFTIRDTEIYVHFQDGLGRSELAAKLAAVIKVSCTTRNIGTVTKVVALFDRTSK